MTTFLRLLAADTDQKGTALADATSHWRSGSEPDGIFKVEPSSLEQVPGSPFAYWVSERVRRLFVDNPRLESGSRSGHIGVSTKDDFRHVRAWWEVSSALVARGRSETLGNHRWVPLAKGGEFSPYYSDLHLVVDWLLDGRIMKAAIAEYRGSRGWGYNWSAAINGHDFYFSHGLTWSRRSQVGLSVRALGSAAIFGDKGPITTVPL